MTQQNNNSSHFSGFALGLTVGVVSALLISSKEGREFLSSLIDKIPEKYKKIPDQLLTPKEETVSPPTPAITYETPHHTYFSSEPPPPAPPSPPLVRPQ